MGNAYIDGHKRLTLRIDPNAVSWRYSMKKRVQETKGGRILQLLGIDLGSLSIQMDVGRGGYTELKKMQTYFRDMSEWHRSTKKYGKFVFPSRNWQFRVLFSNITIADSLDNVTFPVTINFNIQQDVSGVVSTSLMKKELQAIQGYVGYNKKSPYSYVAEPDVSEVAKRYGTDSVQYQDAVDAKKKADNKAADDKAKADHAEALKKKMAEQDAAKKKQTETKKVASLPPVGGGGSVSGSPITTPKKTVKSPSLPPVGGGGSVSGMPLGR